MEVSGHLRDPIVSSLGKLPTVPTVLEVSARKGRSKRFGVEKNLSPLPGI
jgi:hypothetical protein